VKQSLVRAITLLTVTDRLVPFPKVLHNLRSGSSPTGMSLRYQWANNPQWCLGQSPGRR